MNSPAGSYPGSVGVGDFKGDGKLDPATGNLFDNTVLVLLGNDDGTFQRAVGYTTCTSPASVAAGDFNGDGSLDLAITNASSKTCRCCCGSNAHDQGAHHVRGRPDPHPAWTLLNALWALMRIQPQRAPTHALVGESAPRWWGALSPERSGEPWGASPTKR